MYKPFLLIGSLLGALAVGLGAMGAHLLKQILTEPQLQNFETAVRYQMYHSMALILVGILCVLFSARGFVYAGWLMFVGTLLFSGSIYTIVACQHAGAPIPKLIFGLTPLGGLCLIAGWVSLFISAFAATPKR